MDEEKAETLSTNGGLKQMLFGALWGLISWIVVLRSASINLGIEAFENPVTILFTLPTYIPYKLFLSTGKYSSMKPIAMAIFFGTLIPFLPMLTGWGDCEIYG